MPSEEPAHRTEPPSLIEIWADVIEQSHAHAQAMLQCWETCFDPRLVRTQWLDCLSSAVDVYLRSPPFLEATRVNLKMMCEAATRCTPFDAYRTPPGNAEGDPP